MEQEGADLILSIVVPEIGPKLMVIVVERAISWMRPKVRPRGLAARWSGSTPLHRKWAGMSSKTAPVIGMRLRHRK